MTAENTPETTGTGTELTDVLPLTGLQEAIVYHSTRPRPDGATDPYLIVADLDLTDHVTGLAVGDRGTGSADRVRTAIATVMSRHATLRTSYTRRRTGAPVARVHANVEVPLEVSVLDDGTDLSDVREQQRRRGITLTAPPPVRFLLITDDRLIPDGRDGRSRTHLMIVAHHVALDGWSLHHVFGEIVAVLRGESLPAPADVSSFLRWYGSRPDGLSTWRNVLADVPAPTMVALTGEAKGARVVARRLGSQVSQALRGLARDGAASVNTVIQVAWALVLADHTDSDDIVFGAVVSGRDPVVDDVDAMVGMLINTIPVRIRIDPRESLSALISRVQREQLSLVGHHHTPLGDIQSVIGLGELFNTLVVFESFPRRSVRPHIDDENSYAATILVEDEPDVRILLERRENGGSYADAALLDRLVDVLAALVVEPQSTPAGLARSDHASGVVEAITEPARTKAVPVAEQIGRIAHRLPDVVAVVSGTRSVSYAELDDLVARAAGALRARGIGPEDVVAIHAHRSIEVVAALLAVLRVGAAYLPIDPGYPPARARFMLDDAGPDLTIDDAAAAQLTMSPAARAVHEPTISGPDAAAYVVYTSGSTGTPKAVVGTAGALAARISWATESWRESVVLAKSSIAFIDGTTELLGALAAGARVILADDASTRDASALAELARAHRVTQMTAVPSLAHAVDEIGTGDTLARWIVSGEPFTQAQADALATGPVEIINSYGSSEVAGDVTMGSVTSDEITVGRPVPGTRILVLDRLLRPVPAGVTGEIYVGGVQVGRGYRGRAEQTATRFVADPAGGGTRLFRSGDRGYLGTDGRLRLLGRADSQVKIRGVRVELGEVEAAIEAISGVRAAAVCAGVDSAGATRIDAYVCAGPGLSTDDLIDALATTLPAAMIPATVTPLDTLPRTPGGKLDRRALPEPAVHRAPASREPATDTERQITTAASDILGRPVGPDDNFFDVGGHSLSATRLLTRLRLATGHALTIADVFEHPVLADLAALIDTGTAASTPTTMRTGGPQPGRRVEPLPLSPAQQRLLFQSGIDDAAYTVTFAVRLTARPGSAIDVRALGASLTGIVGRHEALRTRIVGGHPVIDDPTGIEIAIDEHDRVNHDSVYDDLVTDVLGTRYDLAVDRMLRATLIHTGAGSATLLIAIHHIAADEWSARQFFDELAAGYNGTTVTAPAVQFVDHTIWQLEQLGAADDPESLAARQLHYWQDALAGIPDEIPLPRDRPRPAEPTHRGDQIDRALPADLVAAIDSRAAHTNTTRFMLVHAAVAIGLSASGAGDDIVVGAPFAGRTTPAAEALIGMFVNTLALRTDLRGNPTLDEVIGRIRATDIAAYRNAELPFDTVVGALAPTRSLTRHPLFQTMVQYRDPIVVPDFDGLVLTPIFPPTRTAKFDLTFEFVGLAEGMRLRLEYATDLFDPTTAAGLADRVLEILAALAKSPDLHLAALRASDTPGCVRALSAPCAATGAADSAPEPATLSELFARSVAAHGDRPAVSTVDGVLTYRDLDARSARLAAHLISDGVVAGALVALMLPRGTDQIIAILAVLRAGGAYVPIDPDYPRERLTTIIDDARPVLTVDADYCARAGTACDDSPEVPVLPPVSVTAAHPAYVIYTSGSTGRPKGVTVSQGSVIALLAATRELIRTDASDVWTLFHSYAFDFSVWEIWGALVTGARLVIPDRDTTRSPADFAALIAAERVTVLNQTPSAFAALDATLIDSDVDLSSLRYLIFGGEALDATRLTGFLRRVPGLRAINMYGITEITVHATYLEIDAERAAHSVGSDVGALLPGFTGALLDGLLRPVPVGVVGELYLSGPQMAQGYLHRAALTATRFVPDPTGSGQICYRTGDLFRGTHDGRLLYVGRADSQVKIRGFRIELGEICSATTDIDGVRDAAVITRPGPGETHRLLAYVVADRGADEIHARLRERLPEHMVPSAVVAVDAIPLTINGKTDVTALPDPTPTTTVAGRAPATEAERRLAEIFADTLHLDPTTIGLDEDFFALGGDSIVSTTLVNRARRVGLHLTPRDVFTHRTIEGIAAVAAPVEAGATTDTLSGATTSVGVIPLLPIMHRLRELGGRIDRHNQSLVIDTPPDATPESITAALQALLDTHESLRMSLTVVAGGVWTLTAGEPGSVRAAEVLEVVPIDAHGSVHDTVTVVSDAAAARLSPTTGRMLSAAFLEPASGVPGRLILVIHHLAVDGVSRRIIIDDLAAFHTDGPSAAVGEVVPLGEVATAVTTRAAAPELLGEVAHWAQVLSPGGDLLPGCPARPGTVGAVRRHVVSFDSPTSQALLTEAPGLLGVGVTAIFLGALRIAATAVCGSGDLVVDTERHGRDTDAAGLGAIDLSHTVGWFTTMAPLRLPAAAPNATALSDTVDAIRIAEQLWSEMPSVGAGFGMLRYLNPQTSMALASLPRASVLLNYLGRFTVGTGGAWAPSVESVSLRTVADPDLGVAHPLEIEVVCRDETDGPVVSATFIHLPSQLDSGQIEALAAAWHRALVDLTATVLPAPALPAYRDSGVLS